ncbi:hypothetical protein GBAR_LOCUS612 [Geodia barretti]|uniref:Uncharacterized protein n=1 Tax=Geodia barretti TaxID=519541 RepID=A0AA35VT23_GEOBA|nr:hypothetical protein GBAR_LOCUS612 [Geodia barretti]
MHEATLALPYHFRKADLYQEGDGEGQRTLKRQGSLKRSLSLKKKSSVREPGKETPVKRTDSFGNKKELVIRRTGSLK